MPKPAKPPEPAPWSVPLYVVYAVMNFRTSPDSPFPLEIQGPPGAIGYFPVFKTLELALAFAQGDLSLVKRLQVTFTSAEAAEATLSGELGTTAEETP